MSEDVQYKQGCAVQIRHLVSRSEEEQYKQVDHHVLVQLDTIKILSI